MSIGNPDVVQPEQDKPFRIEWKAFCASDGWQVPPEAARKIEMVILFGSEGLVCNVEDCVIEILLNGFYIGIFLNLFEDEHALVRKNTDIG